MAEPEQGPNEDKTCFVIGPLGEDNSEIRDHSDKVLKHIIVPCVTKYGYKAVRADQISEPGIITSQILQSIEDSQLVIADLTDRNPNVFYELAVRHATKKPVIQMIKRGEQIPFDLAVTRTVHFVLDDLDRVEEAKSELCNQVVAIEHGNFEMDTPISVALDLKMLRESENPEQRSLAEVIEATSELRSSILSLERIVINPELLLPPQYFKSLMQDLVFQARGLPVEFVKDFSETVDHVSNLIGNPEAPIEDIYDAVDTLKKLERFLSRRYLPSRQTTFKEPEGRKSYF